ncbi:MAG: DEAD/DEAH box helicase family protein, partial [Lachnospiraceae bacterium]|nr:DEAD/DEAH box helicase family protein [Lachnospiraceae bacterium]
ELEEIYNEKFGGIKQRHFDGSFLEFPGMNPNSSLFGYQKNAVARILFSPNTLLSHDVGAGKTYIMIAAGMELKRLGLSSKNLYVVPNNIIGQWRRLFYELYPSANILCVEPKDFVPRQRNRILLMIQKTDYDAVIMPYSCFTQIEISMNCRLNVLQEEAERLRSIPIENTSSRLRKKREKLTEEIEKMQDQLGLSYWYTSGEKLKEKDENICFDQLGITRLFVDEAHNFKNVPIETKIDKVMGISPTGSKKCKDMMDKVRIVQHDNGGAGVIFATGTPITNSITDAFIMQSYLQSGDLELLGIRNFDSWIGMFAEKNLGFEIDVDTGSYRMATRFSKFHNIPELTNIMANVADFHQMDEEAGLPEHDGYRDVLIRKTREFREYLENISERADNVRNGRIKRTEDNMLLITTDGRKAALDMRLVKPQSRFTTSSKVFECAQNVTGIYKETAANRSTQLIFCDTSTPKEEFNIYDELKDLLVKMGVAEKEIAYVHDATTERSRERLFEAMRIGSIRILIGSTFKLGLGVNVQTKLIALHHLDVPWRPSDMVQREGRILRQGNENKKVRIYRYITEGSFDAYSWQLLETKQRFITDILSGSIDAKSGSDVDNTVLDYAEVKALAVGNPLIKERVEIANELMKHLILQRKLLDKHAMYEAELPKLKDRCDRIKELLPKVRADSKNYLKQKITYKPEQRRFFRDTIYSYLKSDEPLESEQTVAFYNGFAIVIPQNTSLIHPVVYVQNVGRYLVELHSNELLSLSRIDSVLDGLKKREEDLVHDLKETNGRIRYIRQELNSDDDFAGKIRELKEKLATIDNKLGVDQK